MKLFAICALLIGCAAPIQHPEPQTFADQVDDATYLLITPSAGGCTAWGIDETHAVTAGHCCVDPGTYTLITRNNHHIGALVEKTLYDYDKPGAPDDACLLETSEPVNFVDLAPEMPGVGVHMETIGFPHLKYADSHGEYLGDQDGPFEHLDDYTFTAPCDHGASGSAVFTDDGVFGILVRLYVEGDQIYPPEMGCVASPLSQIHELLGP